MRLTPLRLTILKLNLTATALLTLMLLLVVPTQALAVNPFEWVVSKLASWSAPLRPSLPEAEEGYVPAEVESSDSVEGEPSEATVEPAESESFPLSSQLDKSNTKALLTFVQRLIQASNQHNVDAVMKHYAVDYLNSDGLSKSDLKALVERTWALYPDIQYASKVLGIQYFGDWAMIQTLDTSTANSLKPHPRLGKTGRLKIESKNQQVLRYAAGQWRITSDSTLFETAKLHYGDTKGLSAFLSAPPVVRSGEPYSAKLYALPPAKHFVIASITQEPIQYPPVERETPFRTLGGDRRLLERVFEANTANRNEIITATLGLTQIVRDEHKRPQVSLRGLEMHVRRVNVLPVVGDASAPKDPLVDTSANGLIRVNEVDVDPAELGLGSHTQPPQPGQTSEEAEPSKAPEAPETPEGTQQPALSPQSLLPSGAEQTRLKFEPVGVGSSQASLPMSVPLLQHAWLEAALFGPAY